MEVIEDLYLRQTIVLKEKHSIDSILFKMLYC